MTGRPTTMVESDQLASAAVDILKTEDFVPKGKRWPFSRHSKAHRDYDKAVQDITVRRRTSRERALEEKLKSERGEVDGEFERAKASAEAEHHEKIVEVKKPFDEVEARARRERDAAITAANLAYQESLEDANRIYQQEASTLDQKRDAAVLEAKTARDAAYVVIDSKRQSEWNRIAKELKTIPLEGPMRVVEDRQAWSVLERKKALMGLVDMAGREDFDGELTDLCLRNVAGYVFQDRFLTPDAQQHRLMDSTLLEGIVELARRTPDKRPIIVRYMNQIVTQNFGHSSPAFIRLLTELYVVASSDTETVYAQDAVENEKIVETMREQIADTLKLTPRRSQVPPSAAGAVANGERVAANPNEADTAKVNIAPAADVEITAEVDVQELVAVDQSEVPETQPRDANAQSTSRPPPIPTQRKGKKAPVSERT